MTLSAEHAIASRGNSKEQQMNAIKSGSAAHGSRGDDATTRSTRTRNWLGRFFDDMEEKLFEREREEMEAFLGEATDFADLEQRMREWDRSLAQKRLRNLGF
jgi:uncharacterized protein DUF3563